MALDFLDAVPGVYRCVYDRQYLYLRVDSGKEVLFTNGLRWIVFQEMGICSSAEGLLETKTRRFFIQFPAIGNSSKRGSPSTARTVLLQRAALRRPRQVGDPEAPRKARGVG